MGRLGKSSLAARLANRLGDSYRVAVVYEHYDPVSVVDALRKALEDLPAARTLLEAAAPQVLDDPPDQPRALRGLLLDLLAGPCRPSKEGRPLLLIVDDFERLLDEPEGDGQDHQVKPDAAPVLRTLLEVFETQRSRSRLLLTSRYTFTLPDGARDLADKLELLQLGSLPEAAQRKLVLREEQRAESEAGLGKDALAERRTLLERARVVARGNPGLQELFAGMVLGAAPDKAEQALAEMELYLAKGDLPTEVLVQQFLQDLALDRLVDLASGAGRELLRRGTLFTQPVPLSVLADLGDEGAAAVTTLLGLGLLDRFEDLVKPPASAAWINPLAAPRAGKLMDSERRGLARHIHGVNVRSRDGSFAARLLLRQYVAPAIADDPDNVLIDDVYWGDVGVSFAWDGASRPLSRILGKGAGASELAPVEGALTAAAFRNALERVPQPEALGPSTGGLISGGFAPAPTAASGAIRLRNLSENGLSDLLAAIIARQVPDGEEQARLIVAADAVAHEPTTHAALAAAQTPQEEIDRVLDRVHERAQADVALVAKGFAEWLAGARDRLSEAVSRAAGLPIYTVSVTAAELRRPLNEMVSVFLGDVFCYLQNRGNSDAPGEIPKRLLDKLKAAHANQEQRRGEPLIVLSHSMGGQIVYDALTHFLPGTPTLAGIRVDFWCATASQVGFFEEAKLLLASTSAHRTGHPVPFPRANLGVWWNVWDHNDFLSFTAKDIMAGVDDEPFDSGMSLLGAHGGYLKRPSFHRALAEKLKDAAAAGWRTR